MSKDKPTKAEIKAARAIVAREKSRMLREASELLRIIKTAKTN